MYVQQFDNKIILSCRVEFMERIKAVHDFMEEQKLNVKLIERVENYLSMLWRLSR